MKRRIRSRLFFLLIPIALVAVAALAAYLWLWRDLPSLDALPARLNTPSARIVDRSGRLLYDMLPEEGGRHTVIPLEQIPLDLRRATIATEDANFYSNPGVDVTGILRSFWINLRGGETLAGGSTLTQQVARVLLMDPAERAQRTLKRKLRESILAWNLARRYSKDEILALYLNQTYYGSMAYGVEAAAQTFFGKPAAELDLAESAMIAGLPQAPGYYNPLTDLETAKARQAVVLGLMQKHGYISDGQRQQAEAEPLAFSGDPFPILAPHFVMWVRARLDTLLTQQQIYAHGGVVVTTTLDLDWQHKAETAVTDQLERLRREGEQKLSHNVNNAALVALDPQSGAVLAMVGSPDYFDEQHSGAVNMALSPRQPGSALKPLIYAAAFNPDRASPWTPATLMLDVRTGFVTHEGQAYVPSNYDNLEHGPVLARQALASSLNIPAVLTLQHIGLPNLFHFAQQLGITTFGNPDDYDLSLALGGGDVTLTQLTAAYGALANGGFRVDPFPIQSITGADGVALWQAAPAQQPRVIDPRVAWLITDILSDDDARSLGFGRNSVLRIDRPAAVKTGTTTNFHDNWTVGYTPDLVVGVWSGNANHENMRAVNGLTGAAPIWHQFIRSVSENTPERAFSQPSGLVQVKVCALSGLLPTPACPLTRLEWFIDGTQPTEPDHFYRAVEINTATGALADASTPPERRARRVVLDLPPSAQGWAHTQGLTLLSDLQPGTVGVGLADAPYDEKSLPEALAILTPADRSVYRLTANTPLESQQLLIRAGASRVDGIKTIYLDGAPLATFTGDSGDVWWQLQPGEHTLWVASADAESTRVHFTVKTPEQK